MVRDPVCCMELEERTVSRVSRYGDKTYSFCSEGCQRLFEQFSTEYLNETVIASRSAFELVIIGGGPAGF